MNTYLTSNWCCGQTTWPRPMKFWHKKRQTIYIKVKKVPHLSEDTFGDKSLILFAIWDEWPCSLPKSSEVDVIFRQMAKTLTTTRACIS